MLHPLLYVALITKKHFLTFNHSVLSSNMNNSSGNGGSGTSSGSNSNRNSRNMSSQQQTATFSSDMNLIYPYIHVLNCNASTTIEDLFLFFASPSVSSSSSSVSQQPSQHQRLPMLLTTSPKTPNAEWNDDLNQMLQSSSSPPSSIILSSMYPSNPITSSNIHVVQSKHKRSTSLSIHQQEEMTSNHHHHHHHSQQNSTEPTMTTTITTTLPSSTLTAATNSNIILISTSSSSLPISSQPPSQPPSGQASSSSFKASSPPSTALPTPLESAAVNLKRQSLKGTHNKNIFSFDDRYFMTHLAEHIQDANTTMNHQPSTTTTTNIPSSSSSSVTSSSLTIHNHPTMFHHQHVPSMPSSSPFTSPPSPLQRHGSVLISKRNYKHHSKHQSNQMTSLFTNNFDLISSPNTMLDLGVKIEKMEMENSKNIRILILNNFRSVSKRVKYALLEIFKFKKVILGDKTFDIPFEFICICDTLELPSALLCEFIGFVPSLSISSTFTPQDVQNYSSNIQHIMSQHSKNMDRKSNVSSSTSLIDCVDVTVKIQQYIRDIIAVCRHHPLVKQYPTSEVTNMIIMAAKAYALMWNKTFVTPTHVQAIISNILYHRVECNSEDKWSVLQDVVSCVLPP